MFMSVLSEVVSQILLLMLITDNMKITVKKISNGRDYDVVHFTQIHTLVLTVSN